jgi:hypothetical protein
MRSFEIMSNNFNPYINFKLKEHYSQTKNKTAVIILMEMQDEECRLRNRKVGFTRSARLFLLFLYKQICCIKTQAINAFWARKCAPTFHSNKHFYNNCRLNK